MNCAICDAPESIVIETRMLAHDTKTRRRRECPSCGERFTTYEVYKKDQQPQFLAENCV